MPNGTDVPPASVLDMVQDNPNALHHLVCEGDAAGVRLVFDNFLFAASYSLYCLTQPLLVRNLLAEAASDGNGRLIRSLLEAQNADGYTALHLACRRGSAEIVEAIVAYQENVDLLDKNENPPIIFAMAAGSPQCVRALVRRSSDVNSRLREGLGPTLAHVCAHHGQPECMRVCYYAHLS